MLIEAISYSYRLCSIYSKSATFHGWKPSSSTWPCKSKSTFNI